MDCNSISRCITTITDDTIVIDDSKFIFKPLPVIGEEYEEVDLEKGMLVCSSK